MQDTRQSLQTHMPHRPNNPRFAYCAVCSALPFCTVVVTPIASGISSRLATFHPVCASPVSPTLLTPLSGSASRPVPPRGGGISPPDAGHVHLPSPGDGSMGQGSRETPFPGVKPEPQFISCCINTWQKNPTFPPFCRLAFLNALNGISPLQSELRADLRRGACPTLPSSLRHARLGPAKPTRSARSSAAGHVLARQLTTNKAVLKTKINIFKGIFPRQQSGRTRLCSPPAQLFSFSTSRWKGSIQLCPRALPTLLGSATTLRGTARPGRCPAPPVPVLLGFVRFCPDWRSE